MRRNGSAALRTRTLRGLELACGAGVIVAQRLRHGRAPFFEQCAQTNAAFLMTGVVDEVVLFVESFLMGSGVPAFAPQPYEVRMDLIDAEKIDEKLLKVRYKPLMA